MAEEYLDGPVDPRVGLQLDGKYLLVRVLGKGGMGVVMVALQQPLLREVALKLISGVEVDATARARFVREARAVAALDHPNVVKLVDFGVAELDEPAPYMVMELVSEARSLRQVFAEWKQSPPTWQAFGEVFGQLLAALAAAHDRHIVHRDIKPDNVMAGRAHGYEYFVRVLDFGLAKSFATPDGQQNDMASLTDAGTAAGTPQYMAPEQLKAVGAGKVDARADQYAVAAMMFEVACGRRPYPPSADVMQLVFAKADPDQDPLRNAPELDGLGQLGLVVRRAMAWSADDRYPDCTHLRNDLIAAVAALGLDSKVPLARSIPLDGMPPPLPAPRRASIAAPGARPKMDPPASGTLTIGLPATADLPTREEALPVDPPIRQPAWLWPAVAATGVAVAAAVWVTLAEPAPPPRPSAAPIMAVPATVMDSTAEPAAPAKPVEVAPVEAAPAQPIPPEPAAPALNRPDAAPAPQAADGHSVPATDGESASPAPAPNATAPPKSTKGTGGSKPPKPVIRGFKL